MAQVEAREFREHHIETVQQAMRYGVRVVAGTDAGGWFHGNNSVELDMLVDAGMTPMQAIVAGTSEAAACCGLGSDLGTLEAGKLADIIVVDGNPLRDITVLQDRDRIRLVMKEGQVYRDLLTSVWTEEGHTVVRPSQPLTRPAGRLTLPPEPAVKAVLAFFLP